MLFNLQEFRKPLPAGVLVFASGANRAGEIRGFARVGIPVGVSADQLNSAAIVALIESGNPVMVDSGAFSEVVFTADGPHTVRAIDDREWRRRLGIYLELASSLGKKATVVAPDKVGNQAETLQRLAKFCSELAVIAETEATILLPLQIGRLSHRQFFEAAQAAAGVALMPAMPMRKAATSSEALLSFVAEAKPPHIHLLGVGISTRRAEKLVSAIQHFSPGTLISMDSNRLRAVVGANRPLTRLESELRSAETEDVFGAVDSPVLSFIGEGLDYTDLISSPSQWATQEQLRAIAALAGICGKDTARFLETPDEFLQTDCTEFEDFTWIEHPVVAYELDRSWQQYVATRVNSEIRSAAVTGVFWDARISGQSKRAA